MTPTETCFPMLIRHFRLRQVFEYIVVGVNPLFFDVRHELRS
jgi:hypothetical protein